MVGLDWRQRGRAPRIGKRLTSFGAGWGMLFYGRTLYLPPSALKRREFPTGHAIAEGLRPFRRRLYLQRAAVITLRALALAIVLAIVVLCVRIAGVAVPIPLAPSLAAGFGLLIGLCAALLQRPTTPQLAHALDQRLSLREQIGSALDVDPAEGRLAALLHQRATKSLCDASHEYVLPWPSTRHERIGLICLGLVVALAALLAVHAPLAKPSALAGGPGATLNRHGVAAQRTGHNDVGVLRLTALGPNGQTRLLSGSHAQAGTRGAGVAHNGARHGQSSGRSTSGNNGLQMHTSQAQTGAKSGASGSHTGTPATGAGKAGKPGAGGQNTTLHLTSGKNSATGGVMSQSQQALLNLKNSISSARNPPPQSTNQSGGTRGARRNSQNQGQSNGSGQRGAGQKGAHGQGQGRAGARGRSGQRNGPNGSQGSNQYENRSRGQGQPYGNGGYNPEMDRFGRRIGGGRGIDSGAPYTPQNGDNTTSAARLSNNAGIALSGSANGGGQLILTVGAPNRAPTVSGGSTYGGSNGPIVSTPGYVAPDSNTVAPGDRALIRQYFSPPPNSGN